MFRAPLSALVDYSHRCGFLVTRHVPLFLRRTTLLRDKIPAKGVKVADGGMEGVEVAKARVGMPSPFCIVATWLRLLMQIHLSSCSHTWAYFTGVEGCHLDLQVG